LGIGRGIAAGQSKLPAQDQAQCHAQWCHKTRPFPRQLRGSHRTGVQWRQLDHRPLPRQAYVNTSHCTQYETGILINRLDDATNSIAAGAISGMIFKSTRGIKPMLISGGMVASVAGVWAVCGPASNVSIAWANLLAHSLRENFSYNSSCNS
jgi:hypothetical protein